MYTQPQLIDRYSRNQSPIKLIRRSDFSFDTANVPGLKDWLIECGYRALRRRAITEWARLTRGESLIVLYQLGAVVLQGRDIAGARRLLAPLTMEEPKR